MAKGTIKRLFTDRGFGFIGTAEGKDLFFHQNQLEGVDYHSLREGQQVEFEVGQGRNGRPQAVKVRLSGTKGESIPKAAVMGQNRFRTELIVGIIVTLFFGVALYLRVVLPYDKVFVGDWIKFTGTDAYYFMRLVDNLVHNFPHAISFDPYLIYPGGQTIGSMSFFVYLLSGIAWLVGFGSPTQHIVDVVGVYLPGILGALAIIPVYFIGKELFNRWVGIIAAGLLAILPSEFLVRTSLGFADRDALEVLLTVLTMLFFILAIKSARQRELGFNLKLLSRGIIKPVIYSLLTGIFLGFYLLTWLGAFLFVFIIFAYLVIQAIVDHLKHKNINYLGFIGTITFLVALIVFLPSHPFRDYLVLLVIALLTPPVLAVISRLMLRTRAKVGYYSLALLGLGLAGLVVLYIINPSILKSILNQLQMFVPSQTQATILEMEPILFHGGRFSFDTVWGNFTTGFFLSLISLCILIYVTVKQGGAEKTLLIVWSLVILGATLALHRIVLFFTINVALLTGYLSWLVLEFTGFKRTAAEPVETHKKAEDKKGKRKNSPRLTTNRIKMALGVIVVFCVAYFPNISPAINAASQVRFAPSDGWCESLSWMKDNTPDPFADPDFYYAFYTTPFRYPETAYGVASWWDNGYWITKIGHRIPNCSPGSDTPTRQKVASLFTAQDEASAAPIISQLKSRYVIIDYSTAVPTPEYYVAENRYGFSGKFYAVITYAGSNEKNFYDTYSYLKDGKLEQVPIFYPEYYRSLAVRLYNFNGNEVIPKTSTVINYEERLSPDGTPYKQITSAESFPSYKEAEAYVASQKSGNYRIVGNDPFLSPVPLEKLKQYKLVYSSKSSKVQPNKSDTIPEVKTFEYIE